MHLVVWEALMERLIKIMSPAVPNQHLGCNEPKQLPLLVFRETSGGEGAKVSVACSRSSSAPEL